jgi:hypothetical protein
VVELENGVAAAEQAIGPYLKEIGS